MKFILLIFISFTALVSIDAQDSEMTLPYHTIPDYPETYTAQTVAARMVDGLGYRYYWATEGLTAQDLSYKPSDDSRTIDETLDHILGLSRAILNATKNAPNVRPAKEEVLSWEEKRAQTLQNLAAASDILKSTDKSLEDLHVIFQRGESMREFPFWNLLNGQLADAIYHTGQVVAFRRAAGNPMDPTVNVFIGKNRNASR